MLLASCGTPTLPRIAQPPGDSYDNALAETINGLYKAVSPIGVMARYSDCY